MSEAPDFERIARWRGSAASSCEPLARRQLTEPDPPPGWTLERWRTEDVGLQLAALRDGRVRALCPWDERRALFEHLVGLVEPAHDALPWRVYNRTIGDRLYAEEVE